MLEFLDQIDKQLLLALNNSYPTFLNTIMFTISGKLIWIPFYATILYLSIVHWKKESWIIIVGLILSVVLADQIASGVFKNLVQRPRPTHAEDISHLVVVVNGYRGGNYGFVSSHASISLALATLTSLLFRNRIYTISVFVWTLIVSYSRIYLGVHYLGDILGGMFVGGLVAFVVYWFIQKYTNIPLLKIPNQSAIIPVVTLLLSFLSIVIYSGIIS